MKIILRGENQDNIRDILLRALKLDDSETLDEVLIIEGEMGDQLMVHLKISIHPQQDDGLFPEMCWL